MREKFVKQSERVVVSKNRVEPEVFDLSAIENIPAEKVKELYKVAVEKHTAVVLELVTLRIAMDSVLNNVEKAMTTAMNGSPVEIVSEKTSERIDDAFDKALLVYCLESAMEVVTDNAELKASFVQKYMETPKAMAPLGNKSDDKATPGIVTSRSQEALVERNVEALKERVERKLRNADDSNNPYGDNQPEKPNSKVKTRAGRLPVAGTVKRASRTRIKR